MNESATSSPLNTTQVMVETLQGLIQSDYDSLDIVGTVYRSNGMPSTDQLQALCETMSLDWLGIVDAQGNGADCYGNAYSISDYDSASTWDLKARGYSSPYIGRESGRSQITLWVPVYRNGAYWGTVLGNVILSQYYSANIFTFYHGEGRTYLFNRADGTFILKSLAPDGTAATQDDIYSLLTASGNREADIAAFRQTVEAGKPGAAVLNFNSESCHLCFLPIPDSPGWYATTVTARSTLLQESSEVQRMIRWLLLLLCLALASAGVTIAIWLVRKTKMQETRYRETLFANLSANLDCAFLIYEKDSRKTAYASDNFPRLLNLSRQWLSEDAAHLFDWCKIAPDSPQRIAFLDGTLDTPSVCEVCVENELDEHARFLRLELIPADARQALAVLTDITNEKDIQRTLIEAMERAKAASNAKNEFLSAMSHDLRTPINGVVGMTAIAAAHLSDQDRVKSCLRKIDESTQQLLSLINEVLDMSQLESSHIQLASEPFNIAELLQNVLSVNYPGIQNKNHTVKTHIHFMEHEEVIGDPSRLTRVATNLISNAIKYTPPGGIIELTLKEKEPMISGYGCYEFTVSDNGIGMEGEWVDNGADAVERVVWRHQNEMNYTAVVLDWKMPGMDGIETARQIRAQVNSQIPIIILTAYEWSDIMTQAQAAGVNAFLSKPLYRSKLLQKMTEILDGTMELPLTHPLHPAENILPGKRVLIAEDNALNQEIAIELLRMMGIETECTRDGVEVVERFAASTPGTYDLILMDIQMPRQNGYEAARAIRRLDRPDAQLIPIVAMTADAFKKDVQSAREAGMNAHIAKPISVDRLTYVLNHFLDDPTHE